MFRLFNFFQNVLRENLLLFLLSPLIFGWMFNIPKSLFPDFFAFIRANSRLKFLAFDFAIACGLLPVAWVFPVPCPLFPDFFAFIRANSRLKFLAFDFAIACGLLPVA